MKKTILARLVITIMMLSLVPQMALAADGTISANGTHDLSEYGNDSTIAIDPGLTVTLTNTGDVTYTNLRIVCGAGVSLTLSGVKINNAAASGACALAFTGSGNTLTLTGTNSLDSGEDEPGVRVEDTAVLEITGDGKLTAQGGEASAGIGGGYEDSGGTISISGGDIVAKGGVGQKDVVLSGSTRTLTVGGAGIGGGCLGNGGTVTIQGDAEVKVEATGGSYSAGIGYRGDHHQRGVPYR